MTEQQRLQCPPLVEALFEVRWKLEEIAPQVFRDQGFNVAHLRFYEQVKSEFPFIEPLPTLQVPDELTAHVVKYRYRVAKNQWPLVQIGPGVATLNLTTPYDWQLFLSYAGRFLPALFKAYKDYHIHLSGLTLRYINAEPFDYETENVIVFLETHLNTVFQLPIEKQFPSLRDRIRQVNWSAEYELTQPPGTGILRFSTGTNSQGEKSVIWEQVVQSAGSQIPTHDPLNLNPIVKWLEEAHGVIESWFLSMVEGKLLRKYQGETGGS